MRLQLIGSSGLVDFRLNVKFPIFTAGARCGSMRRAAAWAACVAWIVPEPGRGWVVVRSVRMQKLFEYFPTELAAPAYVRARFLNPPPATSDPLPVIPHTLTTPHPPHTHDIAGSLIWPTRSAVVHDCKLEGINVVWKIVFVYRTFSSHLFWLFCPPCSGATCTWAGGRYVCWMYTFRCIALHVSMYVLFATRRSRRGHT